MNHEFKEHDVVTSKVVIGDMPKGTKGTVIHKYDEETVEVEFVDEEGFTIAVQTVHSNTIKLNS